MCFSAEASFSASAVLGIVGIITVKKVKEPSQLAFACIPFLFGFQQLTEGVLWLSLTHKELSVLQPFSTYLFLIIAQIIWPTWVPLSILLLEKNEKHKKKLHFILGIGVGLSIYLTYCYLFYDVRAKISGHHIKYDLDFPHTKHLLWLAALFYFIPTVISAFVSSVKRMHFLGTTILISCVLTKLFTTMYFISIWCFFAAIISILVLLIITGLNKLPNNSVNANV